MDKKERILQQIEQIFRKELDDENLQISFNSSPTNVEQWDSINNLVIITAIEEQFGVSLPIEYYVKMISKFPGVAFAVQKGYTNNVLYPIIFKPSDTLKNIYFGKRNLISSSFVSNFFDVEILRSGERLSEKYKTGDDEIRIRLACHYPVLFIQGWVAWARETPGQASSKLDGGDSLIEQILVAQDLIKSGHITGNELIRDILGSLKKRFSKYVFSLAKKGNFKKINRALNLTGFSIKEVLFYSFYKPYSKDILSYYNAAKPFTINNEFEKII